jgi:hypothetical protein
VQSFVTGHDFSHAAMGEKQRGFSPCVEQKGSRHNESSGIGKEDLREMQGHHPQGSSQGDLRKREAQAAPGLGRPGNRGSFHES